MLKKLVKYGNSTALILDRAILELLNMGEGSTVKLTTDGKSLIITPAAETEKSAVVTLGGFETLVNIGQEQKAAMEADPEKKRLAAEWAPGTANYAKLLEAIAPITSKYMKNAHLLQSEPFLAEVDALAIKHHGDKSSEGFMKGYKVLWNKYVPTYRDMQRELREIYAKIGYPAKLMTGPDWEDLD